MGAGVPLEGARALVATSWKTFAHLHFLPFRHPDRQPGNGQRWPRPQPPTSSAPPKPLPSGPLPRARLGAGFRAAGGGRANGPVRSRDILSSLRPDSRPPLSPSEETARQDRLGPPWRNTPGHPGLDHWTGSQWWVVSVTLKGQAQSLQHLGCWEPKHQVSEQEGGERSAHPLLSRLWVRLECPA